MDKSLDLASNKDLWGNGEECSLVQREQRQAQEVNRVMAYAESRALSVIQQPECRYFY